MVDDLSPCFNASITIIFFLQKFVILLLSVLLFFKRKEILKILNTLDSIVRDSLLTEICFPENGVFRFLTTAFADMKKWQIQILEL